jgi:hypothetical protein
VRPDPYVYCNNIFVGVLERDNYSSLLERQADGVFDFRCPTIAITDNNGRLPLTLSRREFARRDQELISALKRSMVEEFVALAFLCDAQSPEAVAQIAPDRRDLLYKMGWNR